MTDSGLKKASSYVGEVDGVEFGIRLFGAILDINHRHAPAPLRCHPARYLDGSFFDRTSSAR